MMVPNKEPARFFESLGEERSEKQLKICWMNPKSHEKEDIFLRNSPQNPKEKSVVIRSG